MKLINKVALRNRLNHNNYDKIAVWKNGIWAEVGHAYAGEKTGDNPVFFIRQAYYDEMTHRAISDLFHEIETRCLRE